MTRNPVGLFEVDTLLRIPVPGNESAEGVSTTSWQDHKGR